MVSYKGPEQRAYNERVQLQTLGGLALRGSRLGRPKPLLLLTYLALEGAKDRHHLAELFWPDAAEPMGSLRVALAQLRAAAPDTLAEGAAGLAARVEADAVTLLRALDAGDPARATELYQGAFLAGFYLAGLGSELEEWIYSTREFLAGRVRGAWLELAEADAVVGDFRAAARRAEAALDLPGAALPEPEGLERLYRLLVAGSSTKASGLRREAQGYGMALDITKEQARHQLRPPMEAGAAGKAAPHNLPLRATSFVGRDLELVELAKLLAEPGTRLLTLVGPGGVGKTRLAVQAALGEVQGGRFSGVYFVTLEALGEPSLIVSEIAKALELTLTGKDEPLRELTSMLSDRRLLLLLDNFEHLITGAATVAELVRACSGLKVLVTSRERLGLEAEQLFLVEGLPLPEGSMDLKGVQYQDAVQLFVQRAKRVRLDFALGEETLPHVLDICRLLGGSPLGLELAAPWMRLIPLAEIAAEIERNMDFLASSAPDVAKRHRSLRATFEHSWKLLSVREQQTLRQLSVFVGGFTREAASRVAGATIPLLASLVDKSLLRVLAGDRYDQHPLLYQYGREKLTEYPEELAEAKAQHATYFATLATEAEGGLKGAQQQLWLERLEAEHDNLRAVLRRSVKEEWALRGLQMAGALWQFWQMRSYLSEGRSWYAAVLSIPTAVTASEERAKALAGAGVLAFTQGDYAASYAHHAEALSIRKQLGLSLGAARSLYNLGSVAAVQGDYKAAEAHFQESLIVFRELGDPWTIAVSLTNLGTLASRLGEDTKARSLHEESLLIRREIGDQHGTAEALHNLGSIVQRQGEDNLASTLFQEALSISNELGDKRGIAISLEAFAHLALLQGSPERAACLWGAAEALRDVIGAPLSLDERSDYKSKLSTARERLGEVAFAVAWTKGHTMPIAEAVAFALSSSKSVSHRNHLD